jgi:hypothetical protein
MNTLIYLLITAGLVMIIDGVYKTKIRKLEQQHSKQSETRVVTRPLFDDMFDGSGLEYSKMFETTGPWWYRDDIALSRPPLDNPEDRSLANASSTFGYNNDSREDPRSQIPSDQSGRKVAGMVDCAEGSTAWGECWGENAFPVSAVSGDVIHTDYSTSKNPAAAAAAEQEARAAENDPMAFLHKAHDVLMNGSGGGASNQEETQPNESFVVNRERPRRSRNSTRKGKRHAISD